MTKKEINDKLEYYILTYDIDRIEKFKKDVNEYFNVIKMKDVKTFVIELKSDESINYMKDLKFTLILNNSNMIHFTIYNTIY